MLDDKPWKPGVKNIRILIYFNIFSISFTGFVKSFFSVPSNYVFLFAIFTYNVPNWYTMPPPKLSAYTPVFDIW